MHNPAGTIHSFAFDSNSTQMLGILTTGIFEYTNTPTEDLVHGEFGDKELQGRGSVAVLSGRRRRS